MYVNVLSAGIIGLFLLGGAAEAQSLRDVATTAARVDRTDQDSVRAVQIQLQEFGYYLGPIDGIFGQQTFNAAVAAVRDVNLEAEQERVSRIALSLSSTRTALEAGGHGDGRADDKVKTSVTQDSPTTGASSISEGGSSGSSASSGGALAAIAGSETGGVSGIDELQ